MNMRTNLIKLFAIISLASMTAIVAFFNVGPVKVKAADDDAATLYTKFACVACHTKTAAKNFDASLPEADLVQAILKGKKAEKPPNMPAYEAKPMTEDQAKALVTYMKGLKTAAN